MVALAMLLLLPSFKVLKANHAPDQIHQTRVDGDSLHSRHKTKKISINMSTKLTGSNQKSSGPDGFPIFFFQKHWNLIKDDIFKLCADFFSGSVNLERINWVHIALIAKSNAPSEVSEFRPISLINSTCKIISKILATRLGLVVGKLVDISQSGFIRRCIADNIIAAQEVIFNLQKKKKLGFAFKVDFAKAFDSLDWDFLLEILSARGFGQRWLSWIHAILHSAKAQILVNGSTQGYIRCKRGLRQGDPLSPLLFAIAADSLSAMFSHAIKSKVLIGVPLDHSNSICHLQYADDLIIFSGGGREDLRIIKLILYLFEGASGLSINFKKSCLYSTNFGFQPHSSSATILSCRKDCLPLTYLGVPLSGRRPKRLDWSKLINMVKARLSPWKAIYLSLGGRLSLINFVLSTVPVYWMSVFKLPAWVICDIDKIRRDFLWKGPDLKAKGARLIAWKRICRPRHMGGWGILNLQDFNNALLGKWWWKIASSPNGCWRHILIANYSISKPPGALFHSLPRNKSFFWAGINVILPAFRSCIIKSVRNGANTSFWFDRWFEGLPLKTSGPPCSLTACFPIFPCGISFKESIPLIPFSDLPLLVPLPF